jgi:hypothetical protein
MLVLCALLNKHNAKRFSDYQSAIGNLATTYDLGFVSVRRRRLVVYREVMANVFHVNDVIGTNAIDADI